MAVALRALEFNVSHVGHEGDHQPQRGSPDADVLSHARKTNQVIVTSNHDMILLCLEERESVIWIDPRGKQFRWEDHVLLGFNNIVSWDLMLREAKHPVCIRAMRTRNYSLDPDEAARLIVQRMKSIERRKRTRRKGAPPGGAALFSDEA